MKKCLNIQNLINRLTTSLSDKYNICVILMYLVYSANDKDVFISKVN